MDVDLVFRIAAVGIIVAVLNLLLKNSGREDQALMTTIAGAGRRARHHRAGDQPPVQPHQGAVRVLVRPWIF